MNRVLIIIAALAAILLSTPAAAQTNACTLVSNATFQDINVFSDCKRVTNNSGATVCAVSNVDVSQWQSFYNNPPSGVTIGSCPATCAGYSYGGYCYYVGVIGASCDSTCSSRGGCNLAGLGLVGASDSHCTSISMALGAPNYGGELTSYGIGCSIYFYKSIYYGYRDVNGYACAASDLDGFYNRICACNN